MRLQKKGESRTIYDAGWSSLVARRAHNPEVVGSNPTPATNLIFEGRAQAPGLFVLRLMSRVSGKAYFVYVLWSASGRKFYIGIREDVALFLQDPQSFG